jgi:serine phosphatase RsbU (regulator of sigma subunit)
MNDEKNRHNRSNNIFSDVKSINLKDDFTKEYRALKDFYLDDEKKDKLKRMGRLERFIYQLGYLFSSIFQKLTPLRKLLVIVGLVLMLLGSCIRFDDQSSSSNDTLLGGLLIFFVLVLELKDKLLAVEELIAGRKIQKALMPVESPHIDGWDIFLYTSSANEVSGDLVDFLKINNQRYAATIADVAGKGLTAALLTAKLQATVRAYADTSETPAELTNKTNKIFHRDSLLNLFASMIYIELAPNSYNISYANAGHFPPVILSEEGLSELGKGDAALGILSNSNYRNFDLVLKTDQLFITYSDGITEARNETGEFFGKERFYNLLKPNKNLNAAKLGRKIISAVNQFRGQAKINDDISLVILKKT